MVCEELIGICTTVNGYTLGLREWTSVLVPTSIFCGSGFTVTLPATNKLSLRLKEGLLLIIKLDTSRLRIYSSLTGDLA